MGRTKYCYINPEFPRECWMAMVFVRNPETGASILIHLNNVEMSLEGMKDYIKTTANEINKKPKSGVIWGGIIFKLAYRESIPLVAQYWTKRPKGIPPKNKIGPFTQLADKPGLYRILVVPRRGNTKTGLFKYAAIFPFLISDDNSSVAEFIFRWYSFGPFSPVLRHQRYAFPVG
jgi:hypothetical protein